jgi:uncharacterized protein
MTGSEPEPEVAAPTGTAHAAADVRPAEVRPVAEITVASSLAVFLRPRFRLGPVRVKCDGVSSLVHVVQSIGVPLTEVGGLLVNGKPAAVSYRPSAGDAVGVSAMPRPQRLEQARFVLDVHLGTVARWLRLVGVDAAYSRDADDDALMGRANAERRVLLTQDRGLLQRRGLWLGAYVRGGCPADQFADVLDRFAPPLAPWTRCTACNGLVTPARKADIEPRLKPGTNRTYQDFSRCQCCGKVYWRGAHGRRLEAIVASAAQIVSSVSTGEGA